MLREDDLKPCDTCRGSGRVRGVFHSMECDTCDGVGYVDPCGHWLDSWLVAVVQEWRKKELVDRKPKKEPLPTYLWLRGYDSLEDVERGIRRRR